MSDLEKVVEGHTSKIDQIHESLNQQQIVTAQMIVVSQNQSKSLSDIEKWVDKHTEDYHELNSQVTQLRYVVGNWTDQFVEMKNEMKLVRQALNQITQTGLKIKGGWIAISLLGSVVMALVSLAKAFGLI